MSADILVVLANRRWSRTGGQSALIEGGGVARRSDGTDGRIHEFENTIVLHLRIVQIFIKRKHRCSRYIQSFETRQPKGGIALLHHFADAPEEFFGHSDGIAHLLEFV